MPHHYVVPMPSFQRSSRERERAVHELQCLPPHELLAREMARTSVETLLEGWDRAANYDAHAVVRKMQSVGTPILPLALYLDVVQQTKSGSMLAVSITNLVTDRKHVVCTLRKRLLRGVKGKCGCRADESFILREILDMWVVWALLRTLWCEASLNPCWQLAEVLQKTGLQKRDTHTHTNKRQKKDLNSKSYPKLLWKFRRQIPGSICEQKSAILRAFKSSLKAC